MHVEVGDVGLDRVVAWYFKRPKRVFSEPSSPSALDQEATA